MPAKIPKGHHEVWYSIHDRRSERMYWIQWCRLGRRHNDRKSTSGYVFMFNGGAVSWSSKKQRSVVHCPKVRQSILPSQVLLKNQFGSGNYLWNLEVFLNARYVWCLPSCGSLLQIQMNPPKSYRYSTVTTKLNSNAVSVYLKGGEPISTVSPLLILCKHHTQNRNYYRCLMWPRTICSHHYTSTSWERYLWNSELKVAPSWF